MRLKAELKDLTSAVGRLGYSSRSICHLNQFRKKSEMVEELYTRHESGLEIKQSRSVALRQVMPCGRQREIDKLFRGLFGARQQVFLDIVTSSCDFGRQLESLAGFQGYAR